MNLKNGALSCPHLRSNPNLQSCFKTRFPGRVSIRRDPSELPRCSTCDSLNRLYACVTCASLFCISHAPTHAGKDHEIAVDVDRAELFCLVCFDQVYDSAFDRTVVLAQTQIGMKLQPTHDKNLRSKRRRIEYRPWAPDGIEKDLIEANASVLEASEYPSGLRGMNNLGNTCFMNSVLQALFHTPPLRNYFLSDRHNRFFCQQGKNGVSKSSKLCLACDMDEMFSAVFSGERTPYSPAKFLYSWWQHAANLASYEQQDAHEFFISMLDGIHEKVEKDKRKPQQSQGSGECCIAHRVFSGILRSDVMCTACGFTSTTFDPCVDISLDLETNQGASKKNSSTKSQNSCNGKESNKNPYQNGGMSTLIGCLDRFTKPEKLGSEQKFFCQQCQVRQESLKQMSIKKLPLVSCFHIKRFEHSPIRKMSRKIDRYLQFPFSLDMGPYLSSSILRNRFGNRIYSFEGEDLGSPNEPSSEFELFAVITHSGKLDAGHYVTYLRLSNQWYKCDDAWVTQVNENIVRATQGYMMFYVQKMLYYKASEKQAAL